ncbi:lipoyl(octanoyl) transferase [Hasllibacter halocynthiae]|uniref:Octanoyltransferase n=1 Tax=Hasllibacter halocynthiae TaxID=595589 RepID=A0A2T0X6C2_9RHOB|nr:lipoyl(octanoyl) transferase [Hasllibacter halocynthiae]
MEWIASPAPVDWPDADRIMQDRVAALRRGEAGEAVWLLEHPALYTAGTSARPEDLREARLPVHEARRGGRYTYHGPGQRVAYVVADLAARGRDVRAYVRALEGWIVATLAEFGLQGLIRPGRVGVWIARPDLPPLPDGTPREDKIAAIGVRVRRWTAFHGLSVNVEPDLSHYAGIVPCGIEGHGVTSLVDLGLPVTMGDLDAALKRTFDAFEAALPRTDRPLPRALAAPSPIPPASLPPGPAGPVAAEDA